MSLLGDDLPTAKTELGCLHLSNHPEPPSCWHGGRTWVSTCSGPLSLEAGQRNSSISFQVLYSLLNQSENTFGWPQVVSEDIVKQVHKLKNEMFVMGGKIKGKTLLSIPEHLGRLDGTLDSMER